MENKPVLYNQFGKEIVRDVQVKLDTGFSSFHGGFRSTSTTDIETKPYQHHVWIFTCVWTIVKNVSRLPLVLYNEKNPTELIREHEVLTTLRKPNPLMTRTTFIQAILLSLLLPSTVSSFGSKKRGGQCFLVCLGGKGNEMSDSVDLTRGQIPFIILPFTDNYIKPKLLKKNGQQLLTGWEFEINGYPESKTPYGVNEIIRISQFNPYDWLSGISNCEPVTFALLQDIKSDVYNDNMFSKGNVPVGVLESDELIGRRKREEQIRYWNETVGNVNNTAGIGITEKGLKYKQIGMSNVDMQYKEMKEFLQEQFTAAYGLNKIAMGKYEEINRATIIEGRKMLWMDTYLPMAQLIEEALNSQWIEYIEDGLRIKFDTSGIPALRPDYTARAKNAGVMVEKMFFPPILAAELNEIPLPEDALKKYPWLSMNPAEIKDKLHASTEEKLLSVIRTSTPEDKDAFWKNYVRQVLDPSEKDLKDKMVRFFNRQRNLMQDKVDVWLSNQKKSVDKAVKPKPDDFLFDKKAETELLVKMFEPIVRKHMKVIEINLEDELGELIEFQVTNEMVLEYVKDRKKELLKINNTTFNKARDKISDAIDLSVKENMTPQETAKEIKKAISVVGEVRKNQSKTIARTEIGCITSKTRFNAFKIEGIEFHEWFTALDESVRHNHRKVHASVRKIGNKFPYVNMMYPLDSHGDISEIVNCRCVALAHAGPEHTP